jgi:hypothetical protein
MRFLRPNFAPLYLGALGPEILRQAIGGFPDDFQIADDRVDGFIVFYESVVIQPGYVTLDFLNRFPNILDKKRRCPTGHQPSPL